MAEAMDLIRTVGSLAERNRVFRPDAYFFVLEAVELAVASLEVRTHISGETLLEWIRHLGQQRYGIMAGDVFRSWGVHTTLDFGRIVFHLVVDGLLRKTDEDTLSDFIDKFDFDDAFALKSKQGQG